MAIATQNATNITAPAMKLLFSTLIAATLLSYTSTAQTTWAPALDATSEGNHINVAWTAAPTSSPATYTIERSKFGEQWEVVSTTDRLESINTTIDARPMHGLSYYRISKTDAWGETQASAAVAVRMEHNALDFNVTPHPATGNFFTIALKNAQTATDGPISVSIVDLTGQYQLRETEVAFNRNGRLAMRPVHPLATGMYVVVLERGGQKCSHQLLIVNE